MGISSREAANTRFAGSGASYDAGQVDAYTQRVADTLAAHEKALEEAAAEISRLEHALDVAHAVHMHDVAEPDAAGSVLGRAVAMAGVAETAPAPQSPADPGAAPPDGVARILEIEDWADAKRDEAERRGRRHATDEEIRRLTAKSNALAAEAAVARHLNRKRILARARDEADSAITVHLEAAGREAALVLEQSLAEADRIVEEANRTASERTRAAELELAALNRRLTQLRIAISQAGASLDELVPVSPSPDDPDSEVEAVIDLEHHSRDDTGEPDVRGFYERRLEGLRKRLENS